MPRCPALLRSIYAYHVKSRGWSDIGYNYLIDRFGRIWEGRYGGVDRPVVGAHTLGYNDDSFAASAIGNYQIAKPSKAMIQAYAALFAWKLSLHGVDAASTHQWVTKTWFQAINGHRDAASTAVPGPVPLPQDPEDPASWPPPPSAAGPVGSWSPTWRPHRRPTSSSGGRATARRSSSRPGG